MVNPDGLYPLFMRYSWELKGTPVQKDEKVGGSDKDVVNILSERLPDRSYFAPVSGKIFYKPLIAIPTMMAYMHSRNYIIGTLRNRWRENVTLEDRKELLSLLGIRRDHKVHHVMLGDEYEMSKYVSYLAASFAFTTYVAPIIVGFSELANAAHRDETDSSFYQDYADIEQTPLLIVTNAMAFEYYKGKFPLHVGVDLMRDRVSHGRVTVFVDALHNSLVFDNARFQSKETKGIVDKYAEGKLTTPLQWSTILSSSKGAQGGIAGFLQSGYVYKSFNWIPQTLNGGGE